MVYAARYRPYPDTPPNVADVSRVIRPLALADENAGRGLGAMDRITLYGCALDEDTVPTTIEWQSPRGVQDFEDTIIIHVSERFMTLIEDMEPDVHQFVPFDLIDRRNALVAKRFCCQVCSRIDTVAPDDDGRGRNMGGRRTFVPDRIGDRHFWIDPGMQQRLMLSDDAMAMLNENDISGFKLDFYGYPD
jgi:hypothetical protein